MTPIVSVIIPLYNTEAYIVQALTSVLEQSEERLEILVVDDASSDGSVAAVQALSDRRIKLLRHETNQGASAARNTALDVAQGEWIALLDSDDWFSPDHLAYLLRTAGEHHADLAADNQVFVSEDGMRQTGTLFGDDNILISAPALLDPAEYLLCKLAGFQSPRPGLLKPIIRRQFLKESKIRYQSALPIAEDYLFYCLCLIKGAHFVIAPEAHYFYRSRANSTSDTTPLQLLRNSRQVEMHLLEHPFVQSQTALRRGVAKKLATVEREIRCLEMRTLLKSHNIQPLMRQPQYLSVIPYFGYRAAQNLWRRLARGS